MSEQAQTPAAKSQPAASRPAAAFRPSPYRAAFVAAVGGLLTVAAVALTLKNADFDFASGGDPAQPTLSFVAQRDLGEAASTLTPAAASALVEDAQRCRIPLASMTISRGTAAIGSMIRIRSGNYVSPYFTVTENMQRIAVPYPAPYGSGAGTIVGVRNLDTAVARS
jgi:hypothetical protein